MNKREFERELFLAMDGFFGGYDWLSKDGRGYQHVMDDLAMNCTDEQWLIVDETMQWLANPQYITGEAACDTPVSPNEWIIDYDASAIQSNVGPLPEIEAFIAAIQQMNEWIDALGMEQAWNCTELFATEREAFIVAIQQMNERIDALVAELIPRKIK